MRFITSFVLPLLLLAVTISASCPPEDQISPCECIDDEDEGYLEVDCSGENLTLEKLKSALKAFQPADSLDIVLDSVNLGSLPSNFFQGLNVKKLEISHCELDSLAGDGGKALSGLEDTLEELVIMSSFSEENQATKLDLSHLRKLSELDLSFNAITELGNDWFERGPASLTRVTFSNNGIEKVGDRAFASLSNLQTLSFDGNRFGSIKRSMLPNPANALETFELDNNAFTSVPQDLFTNMPALKILSLRTNGLAKIPEQTYKSVWQQLDVIDFRGNPLECDSHIDWIINLKTSGGVFGKCQGPHERRDVDLDELVSQ